MEYKMQSGVNYRTMSKVKRIRDKVKKDLIEEQGYICCYCGERIEFDEKTSIEHFLPKEIFPYLDLQYSNLLAVCDGGKQTREEANKKSQKQGKREKNRAYPLYCDAFKNDKIISLSPLQGDVEQQFCFYQDGSIEGLSDEAKEAINKLHLDNQVLNTRRKYAIDAYASEEFDLYKPEQWADEIKWLEKRNKEGKFEPFCFVKKRYIEDNMM